MEEEKVKMLEEGLAVEDEEEKSDELCRLDENVKRRASELGRGGCATETNERAPPL
jgi:hypothetical protein